MNTPIKQSWRSKVKEALAGPEWRTWKSGGGIGIYQTRVKKRVRRFLWWTWISEISSEYHVASGDEGKLKVFSRPAAEKLKHLLRRTDTRIELD